jgi:hypothetical protein
LPKPEPSKVRRPQDRNAGDDHEVAEAAQAAIKALDPPPGIADWHQTQIEWFGLESLFARAVVKNGITVTKPAYDAAKERFMAEANDELVRAVETCPELATLNARVVVGATPEPRLRREEGVDSNLLPL